MKIFKIYHSKQYKKDLKRIKKSGRYDIEKLEEVIDFLASGENLLAVYKNHNLNGALQEFQECHIEADWLLIYKRLEDALIIQLIRTGSHGELF